MSSEQSFTGSPRAFVTRPVSTAIFDVSSTSTPVIFSPGFTSKPSSIASTLFTRTDQDGPARRSIAHVM
jgi:hypothetical protein